MAITALGSRIYYGGPPNAPGGALALSGTTLNAAGDKAAFVFQCPKAGTLDWFEWRTASVTNVPDNGVRMSFQDVSATTGVPDDGVDQFFVHAAGTLAAATWQVPSGPITSDGTGGGVKRTVTQGQWLAAVIDYSSFATSDSFQVATVSSSTGTPPDNNLYYCDGSSGTYAKAMGDWCVFALRYSDGTYANFDMQVLPASAVTNTSFNSGSAADERALRFQVPVAMRILGVTARCDINAGGDVDWILYDSSSNVLASVSVDGDISGQVIDVGHYLFTASYDLAANTTYRLSMKPTTATSGSLQDITVNNNANLQAMPGGIQWYGSTRVDGGAWTDSTTTRPLIGLIIDGIDVSGGGGAHSAPFFG
jgi:hypothetical protein